VSSKNGEPLFAGFPIEGFVSEDVVGVSHFDNANLSRDIVSMTFHDEVNNPI
jgi:hypothetical protein